MNGRRERALEIFRHASARCGFRDRGARGVVDGEPQVQPRAVDREALGVLDRAHEIPAQPIAPADDAQANAVVEAARRLADEIALQEAHQARDFLRRPRPVVRGERVQRQDVDRAARCGLDDSADGFGAGAMAGRTDEAAALRPTTVAVHDDRSVHRS